MKPRWTIAGREARGVLRERTILLAVVIQVFVAGFSSFLVVGLSALVDPDAFPTGARPIVATSASRDLDDRLAAAGIEVVAVESADEAVAAFRAGEVDAALFERGDRLPRSVTLLLPDGDLRATLALVKVKGALEAHERALRDAHSDRLRASPAVLEVDAPSGSYAFVYTLLVPLLVLLPVVLAGALTADSITEEVQRGTLPLLLSSPATAADVVEGKVLANVAFVPALGATWLGLLALNDLPVPVLGAVLVLLLATAVATSMSFLACGIALATRDRNRTHVLYATAFFLALALSLALPVSPVNAIALLAAGSPSLGAVLVVLGCVAVAAVSWVATRVALRHVAPRLAAGT